MISPYLLERGRIAVKQARHGLVLFNRNDLVIGRSIDAYGEWCEEELLTLGMVVRPGDTVLDVGANIGTHTLAFAAMVGPAGQVLAFEPQALVFQMLCANMALNSVDHVRCLNQAVGQREDGGGGHIPVPRVAMDRAANFGELGLRGPAAPTRADNVKLVAIDDLDLPACRLIKADVQGMEAEVLRSAQATIARLRPYLYVECETEAEAPEVIGLLEGWNYDLWWHAVGYHRTQNFYANPVNAFPDIRPAVNLLAIPTELQVPVQGFDRCQGVADNAEKFLDRLRARLG